MGLFGKKKYQKNVTRDNVFLKNYAVRVNALINFARDNSRVTGLLEELRDDFQYTVPTEHKDAKKLEKQIDAQYQILSNAMSQSSWNEDEIINLINSIRQTIIELTSKRYG